MQWPEQDQHSQNQHSRPAAGLRGLVLESVWEGVLMSVLVSALALASVSGWGSVSELVSVSESVLVSG